MVFNIVIFLADFKWLSYNRNRDLGLILVKVKSLFYNVIKVIIKKIVVGLFFENLFKALNSEDKSGIMTLCSEFSCVFSKRS